MKSPQLWHQYNGEELAIYWKNPYDDSDEKIASFWWPAHPPEKTNEVERTFEMIAENAIKPIGFLGYLASKRDALNQAPPSKVSDGDFPPLESRSVFVAFDDEGAIETCTDRKTLLQPRLQHEFVLASRLREAQERLEKAIAMKREVEGINGELYDIRDNLKRELTAAQSRAEGEVMELKTLWQECVKLNGFRVGQGVELSAAQKENVALRKALERVTSGENDWLQSCAIALEALAPGEEKK